MNYGDWEGRLFGPPMGPPICEQLGACGCEEPNTGCEIEFADITRCLAKMATERWRQAASCIELCTGAILVRGRIKNLNISCGLCIGAGIFLINNCISPNIKCKQ